MNATSPQRSNTQALLLAGAVAVPASIATVLALKATTLPSGLRVGISFFVFLMVNAMMVDRLTGSRRSPKHWVATVALGVVTAIVMWRVG